MVELKNCHRGFTLIEVLLAAAVLAIVAGPFLTLFLQGFQINQSAGMKTMAVSFSREGMESIRAQDFDTLAEKAGGLYPLYIGGDNVTGEDYSCFYEIQMLSREVENGNSTDFAEFLEITVYVKYFDRAEREVVLISYLARR